MSEQISDSSFEEKVLKSGVPVLVDFWAPWCGPCRALAPVIEEIAQEYMGRVLVVKANVDECPAAAARCGVRAIPTLVLFKNGAAVDQRTGALPKEHVRRLVDGHLG